MTFYPTRNLSLVACVKIKILHCKGKGSTFMFYLKIYKGYVNMKIEMFCDFTSCQLVNIYRRFERL